MTETTGGARAGKVASRAAGRQARIAFLERAKRQAEVVEQQTAAWHAATAGVLDAEAKIREAEQAAETARAERDRRQAEAVAALKELGMSDGEIAESCGSTPSEVRRLKRVIKDQDSEHDATVASS